MRSAAALTRSLGRRVLDPLFWRTSSRELASMVAALRASPSGSAVLDVTQCYRGRGRYWALRHLQNEHEFVRLIDWAIGLRPAITVEIGTYQGATLLGWSVATTGHLISIDLPHEVAEDGSYHPSRRRLYELMAGPNGRPRLSLLQASSCDPSTVEQVRRLLGGQAIDLLFIDGDHRYAGVRRDFEIWSPLVRDGGAVVFHDIVEYRGRDYGVHLLWKELCSVYEHEEIVDSVDQNGCGVGILRFRPNA